MFNLQNLSTEELQKILPEEVAESLKSYLRSRKEEKENRK